MAHISESEQLIMIGFMKREPVFEVEDLSSGKTYRFTFDDENINLFFINNGKRYKITNSSEVLYGIAQDKTFLEVHLETRGDKSQVKMFIMERPTLLLR